MKLKKSNNGQDKLKEVVTKFKSRPKREEVRRNKRIRVQEIRLIDADGTQLGVFATSGALKRAEDLGLDLVEISPNATPPVCKIMDYGKFKYEQKKKQHEAKKKQVIVKVKEIKMRPATDEHDYQTKLKHAIKFLEHGDKVKITIRFRGREMAHRELGKARMDKVAAELKDLAEVTQSAKMEGRQMFMLLSPIKK